MSIISDFSVIMGLHKKTGVLPLRISCSEFKVVMYSCNFIKLDTNGSFFTWAKRGAHSYVECHLDRVFVNKLDSEFWDSMDDFALCHLHSDYNPILLGLSKSNLGGPNPFTYLSIWTTYDGILSAVREAWETDQAGNPIQIIMAKLKFVKQTLNVLE